jgi:hypothetical protein
MLYVKYNKGCLAELTTSPGSDEDVCGQFQQPRRRRDAHQEIAHSLWQPCQQSTIGWLAPFTWLIEANSFNHNNAWLKRIDPTNGCWLIGECLKLLL